LTNYQYWLYYSCCTKPKGKYGELAPIGDPNWKELEFSKYILVRFNGCIFLPLVNRWRDLLADSWEWGVNE